MHALGPIAYALRMMRVILVIVGFAVATAAMAQQPPVAQSPAAQQPAAQQPVTRQRDMRCAWSMLPGAPVIKDLSGPLPIPDYLDDLIACNTPPAGIGANIPQQPTTANVPSPWMASEQELYQRILSQQHVDVLVVPLQVQG